jgi:hypothetical protein
MCTDQIQTWTMIGQIASAVALIVTLFFVIRYARAAKKTADNDTQRLEAETLPNIHINIPNHITYMGNQPVRVGVVTSDRNPNINIEQVVLSNLAKGPSNFLLRVFPFFEINGDKVLLETNLGDVYQGEKPWYLKIHESMSGHFTINLTGAPDYATNVSTMTYLSKNILHLYFQTEYINNENRLDPLIDHFYLRLDTSPVLVNGALARSDRLIWILGNRERAGLEVKERDGRKIIELISNSP